jgi:UDP-glucose 4-epimerase
MTGFMEHPGFHFIEADVRNAEAVESGMHGCQAVVHLAAFKIPRYSDALDTLLINSQGTNNVLASAAKFNTKVVAASTSDVYGKNPKIPFAEESDLVIGCPEVKRWSYAISKMFEEQLMFAYHERFGIDVIPLRYFGGYGPNQNLTWWGGPQSVFIDAAIDDLEIPLHGDGLQTRSFTYISDTLDGTIAALEKPEANNLAFNIGNTQEISILDLARMIWRCLRGDEEPKIKYIPFASFGKYEDVPRRIPEISRARRILGFTPKINLEEGLKITIRWQIKRRRELGIPTPQMNAWDHAE